MLPKWVSKEIEKARIAERESVEREIRDWLRSCKTLFRDKVAWEIEQRHYMRKTETQQEEEA